MAIATQESICSHICISNIEQIQETGNQSRAYNHKRKHGAEKGIVNVTKGGKIFGASIGRRYKKMLVLSETTDEDELTCYILS